MNDVIDLSAKLLANEDIFVQRARTQTASFDIKKRTLTLPTWQDMTPEIEHMLVGHEVGHALYTTEEYSEPMKENPKIRSYMNVLEDVRIEKLMKRKYPGIRKHMSAGYKALNDRDFFEIEGKDVNAMLLIDRINLYFKAGLFTLDFTPEEKAFVNRAEKTETIAEVIALAQEVFEYSKGEFEKKMQEMENSDFEETDDDDEDGMEMQMPYDQMDSEFDDEENEDADGSSGPSDEHEDGEETGEEDSYNGNLGTEQGDNDPLESATQRAFDNNLEDLADTDSELHYWKFDEITDDVVVPFKKIIPEMSKDLQRFREDYPEKNAEHFANFARFKAESLKTVNYLVKEFEMRKSATLYKRAQSAKSGQLDMKKIYGFQINDDLFKRVQIIPEGKNHGMMILLDWSGSMQQVIKQTIEQVINLAMFCQRINIPYRVYAFSSQYRDEEKFEKEMAERQLMSYEERQKFWEELRAQSEARSKEEVGYFESRDFHMLELFNNKMTSVDFWKMAEMLTDWRLQWSRRYALGGTPLNEALTWVYQNIGKFIEKNNIEKMTFITLTDGEGGNLQGTKTLRARTVKEYGYYDRDKEVQVPTTYVKHKHFYRDDVTKKTYRVSDNNTAQTRMLVKMIKDRWNVKTVGFYITRNSKRDLYWAVRSNTGESDSSAYHMIEKMRKGFREDGFFSMKNAGRDEMFIIPTNKMKIDDGELTASGDMTARKLASQFGKYLNQKKTSRVLLSRFIGWVA